MKLILQLFATTAILSLLASAQTPTNNTSKTPGTALEIHHVTAPMTSPTSGEANYKAYCAACHGVSGKGDGPAAPALKIPATDLTRLTANAGGKYPMMHVEQMIRNADSPAHGSKDMPVWGPVFRSLSGGNQSSVDLRVANLAKYIETLQTK